MATLSSIPSLMANLDKQLEDESLFDRLLKREEEMEIQASPFAEMETGSRCPVDRLMVVRGFARYSDDVRLLPPDQQKKLADLAREIEVVASQLPSPPLPDTDPHHIMSSTVPQVLIVGHADADVAREKSEPGFLQFLSEKRAAAVQADLCRRMKPELHIRLKWLEVGVAAGVPAVSAARTEAERQCNRRVELTIRRKGEPQLIEVQREELDRQFQGPGPFPDYYAIALQGTSGQYEHPFLADQKAREIAWRAVRFMDTVQRRQEREPRCGQFSTVDLAFRNALQGTASKFSEPDVVVSKAYEIAQSATLGTDQAWRKFQWRFASLPKPVSPDCVPARGKVPGPANHVLCLTHGHVIDTKDGTVIAHDLDEYKSRPRTG